MTSAPRRHLALAGVLAGLSGIAVSQALTMAMSIRATPLQAVAEVVIAKTPGPVAENLIHLVGRNDKPLLITGVTIGIIALSALAGILAARSSMLGNLVFVVMGVIGGLAVASRPGFTTIDLFPVVVGTLTWIAVLAFLVGAALTAATRAAAAAQTTTVIDGSRRGFLIKVGAVAVGAAVVGFGGQFLGRSRRAVETSRRLLRLPISKGAVPAGADLDVPGVAPWRSDNTGFYRIDTALVVPTVDPNDWRLRIHGMVDRELTISYPELVKRKMTESWVTICCVSNPVGGELIGNAWWSGVRIADLLAEVGVSPDAQAVLQTSHDGWTCGTPIEALTDGRDAMLAVAMNGEPLPVEHGFPVRMIVPGLYGYVSATKWLVDLNVTRYDKFSAYWTERGWSEKGPIKTESRVDLPRNGDQVPAGQVRVGGHAWAQHTGIENVEYRVDGDPWRVADLGRVPDNDTWVQWSGTVDAVSGKHTLAVRATDRSGYTQTAARADVVPDGATGWHTVDFTAG